MPSRLIILLCLTSASATVSAGAFPALLPDLDRAVHLSDVELGAISGAFGFARMLVDIPAGLIIARNLRWPLMLSPFVTALGVVAIGTGGPFGVLIAGRVLMGLAHAFGTIAWLTAILRYGAGPRLGSDLNAFEFSAMIGMLAGIGALAVLPATMPWNIALLVACLPHIVSIVLAPALVASLPARHHRRTTVTDADDAVTVSTSSPAVNLVALAFAAGTTIAFAYSTVELFIVPLTGAREFSLDRGGVAWILILAQLADIVALLPAGTLADRFGAGRPLAVMMLIMAGGTLLVGFGGFTAFVVGSTLIGVTMAGWMLPLALLRRGTPPERIAWRTAVYRVGVDGGLFLGPFVAGFLGDHLRLMTVGLAVILVLLGVWALREQR